jgi:hypothetical protein
MDRKSNRQKAGQVGRVIPNAPSCADGNRERDYKHGGLGIIRPTFDADAP